MASTSEQVRKSGQFTIQIGNSVVIWAPGGEMRPYKCPVSLSRKKSDGAEWAYYIRNLSHAVRANRDEEIALVRRANRTPFDDMVNETRPSMT